MSARSFRAPPISEARGGCTGEDFLLARSGINDLRMRRTTVRPAVSGTETHATAMTARNANPQSPANWLRELASYVDYSRFRQVWLHPVTEQAEQGYLAACYERVAQRANSEGE